MISYAQNFEDVILWRALKHIDNGCYLDVGAQDPIKDSVSLLFYEAGWRGIHVEPSRHYAARLRAARPDERVIEAAVGRKRGTITFYESVGTGLSTCDALLAEKQSADGFEFRETSASSITLSEVLDGAGGREIHWLKVDVEGFEEEAIKSWLPSTVRPWIVVIESAKPGSLDPTFADWEPTLVGLGYDFVYFDGLNRFYLSQQHPELAGAFGPGPNIFDGIVLSGENSNIFCFKLDREIANHRETEHRLSTKNDELELEFRELRQQLAAVELEIAALRTSTSWRITAPLRSLARCVKLLIILFRRLQGRVQSIVSRRQHRMNRTDGSGGAHSLVTNDRLPRSARFVYQQLKAFRAK